MRIKIPSYEGDSFLHADFQDDTVTPLAAEADAARARIVHRTTENGDNLIVDSLGIEQRARSMRSEYVWSQAKAFYEWIENWLDRTRQREQEEYLARAQNLAELEMRLNRLERDGQLLHL